MLADCNWGDRRKSNFITVKTLDLLSLRVMKKVNTENTENTEKIEITENPEGNNERNANKNNAHVNNENNDNNKNFGNIMENLQILHVLEFWSSTYSYKLLNVRNKDYSNDSEASNDGTSLKVKKNENGTDKEKENLIAGTKSNKDSNKNTGNILKVYSTEENLQFGLCNPHCANIFILRLSPCNAFRPVYVGSNLHFTGGLEVKSFSWSLVHGGVKGGGGSGVGDEEGAGAGCGNSNGSISLTFEHCAVRCEEWTGYVWLFIPHTNNTDNNSNNSNNSIISNISNNEDNNNDSNNFNFIPTISGPLVGCEPPKMIQRIVAPYDSSNKRGEGDKGNEGRVIGTVWKISVAAVTVTEEGVNSDEMDLTVCW